MSRLEQSWAGIAEILTGFGAAVAVGRWLFPIAGVFDLLPGFAASSAVLMAATTSVAAGARRVETALQSVRIWQRRKRSVGGLMEQKVVAIGGGTGLSTLLAGLKRYPVFPIAVVTVGDNGGSSGRLREDFGMPPPGDIRNVLVALSELAPNVEQLLQHRFQGPGALQGHAVGNLLLAALQEETGDFPAAVAELSSVLRVHGRVLPVSAEAYTLCAELEDHRTVVGESQITAAGGRIARIWLTPTVQALSAVLEALAEADMIVLGPGSLFTSVLPNLLVSGVADAILHSNARRKVYVCNVMTQPGETDGFTASDHVAVLERYVGPIVDTVVLSTGSLPEEVLMRYAAEGSYPVVADVARLTARGYRVAMEELLSRDGFARHDPVKLAALLWRLAGEKDR